MTPEELRTSPVAGVCADRQTDTPRAIAPARNKPSTASHRVAMRRCICPSTCRCGFRVGARLGAEERASLDAPSVRRLRIDVLIVPTQEDRARCPVLANVDHNEILLALGAAIRGALDHVVRQIVSNVRGAVGLHATE